MDVIIEITITIVIYSDEIYQGQYDVKLTLIWYWWIDNHCKIWKSELCFTEMITWNEEVQVAIQYFLW